MQEIGRVRLFLSGKSSPCLDGNSISKCIQKTNIYFLKEKKKINPGAAILRQNLEKKGVDLSLGIFQGECPGHYQRQSPSTPRLCRVSWGARIKNF